jgi:ATP-dependent protease HslVU (ClpYQ) ATPase subunit
MTLEEQQFSQEASRWARANRTRLAKEMTLTARYPGEKTPVSLFMAGSPGAGKTEAARALATVLTPSEIDLLRQSKKTIADYVQRELPARLKQRHLDHLLNKA